jgi:hypothetical protein
MLATQNALAERFSVLSPKKRSRVLSFLQLVESEPGEDSIYEDLPPDEEDALLRSLSFAPGAWDDE